jgi:hypothetical protein
MPPASRSGRPAHREHVGDGRTKPERRRVVGRGTRHRGRRQVFAEHPQARHVGAGQAHAIQRHEAGGARRVMRASRAKPSVGRNAEKRTCDIDAPGIDPIGQAHQQRNRERVAEKEGRIDHPAFDAAQAPQLNELRQQCREGGKADHRQHVAEDNTATNTAGLSGRGPPSPSLPTGTGRPSSRHRLAPSRVRSRRCSDA